AQFSAGAIGRDQGERDDAGCHQIAADLGQEDQARREHQAQCHRHELADPRARPCIMRPPISTAMAELPGMPNASVGSRFPPSFASFADSTAMTPSIAPLPNFSGVFDICTAVPYAMKLATTPPTPGTMPR